MRTWTDDDLRAAVASSRNVSQTLRLLGLRPFGGNYATVRRRIAELGLSTAHWTRSTRAVDAEVLRDVVASSLSVAECLRRLGWPEAGASRARLRALVEAYALDTSHFLGRRANAGRRFPQSVKSTDRYLVVNGPAVTSTWLRLRLLEEKIFEAVCASCGGASWRGRPIPLELDHINGNRYDNRIVNLRLLCPNCHALTPTYRGRNRNRYPAAHT